MADAIEMSGNTAGKYEAEVAEASRKALEERIHRLPMKGVAPPIQRFRQFPIEESTARRQVLMKWL